MAEIDEFTRLNGYYTHSTRADMFPMVHRARKKALTKTNIIHGFERSNLGWILPIIGLKMESTRVPGFRGTVKKRCGLLPQRC